MLHLQDRIEQADLKNMKKQIALSLLAVCLAGASVTGCSPIGESNNAAVSEGKLSATDSAEDSITAAEEDSTGETGSAGESTSDSAEMTDVSGTAATSAVLAATGSTEAALTGVTATDVSDEDITAEYINRIPGAHMIEDFPLIYQEPELPTGCEITSLTMVLNYYGYDVDKVTMAEDYLPTVSGTGTYYSGGRKYGVDMNNYFVGNPEGHGRVCGTGAITTAADDYLSDQGSYLHATDIRGTSAEDLYELIKEDIPVVTWVTISCGDRGEPVESWYTDYGEEVDWSRMDHCVALIGVTDDTVIIADPIEGIVQHSKEDFEQAYESRDERSVIIE